jgi:hypothetical protein
MIYPCQGYGCVCFLPTVILANIWLAKIFLEVLLAHELATLAKRTNQSWCHRYAKKLATIQTKNDFLVMTKIFVGYTLANPSTVMYVDCISMLSFQMVLIEQRL